MFEKISKIAEHYGFKSINDFALNGLGYKSSEKINRLKDPTKKPSVDILLDITNKFESINLNWLLNDIGEMLINDRDTEITPCEKFNWVDKNDLIEIKSKSIPFLPINTIDINNIDNHLDYYLIPEFQEMKVQFLIRIMENSMYPKFNSGDIIGCIKLDIDNMFFQWNRVYVLATEQGTLIRHVKKGKDSNHILLVSENESYEPFELNLNRIKAIALVVGFIRMI